MDFQPRSPSPPAPPPPPPSPRRMDLLARQPRTSTREKGHRQLSPSPSPPLSSNALSNRSLNSVAVQHNSHQRSSFPSSHTTSSPGPIQPPMRNRTAHKTAARDSPLQNIRRKVATQHSMGRGAVANLDSAYNRLKRSNDAVEGIQRPPNKYDLASHRPLGFGDQRPQGEEKPTMPKRRKKMKTTIGTFSVRQPKPEPPQEKEKEEPECWRPANNIHPSSSSSACTPTETLGIARIATWRLEAFEKALLSLLEEHGVAGLGELQTSELLHGGESVTDVLVVFDNEEFAEEVRGKVDGATVLGRKVIVTFV